MARCHSNVIFSFTLILGLAAGTGAAAWADEPSDLAAQIADSLHRIGEQRFVGTIEYTITEDRPPDPQALLNYEDLGQFPLYLTGNAEVDQANRDRIEALRVRFLHQAYNRHTLAKRKRAIVFDDLRLRLDAFRDGEATPEDSFGIMDDGAWRLKGDGDGGMVERVSRQALESQEVGGLARSLRLRASAARSEIGCLVRMGVDGLASAGFDTVESLGDSWARVVATSPASGRPVTVVLFRTQDGEWWLPYRLTGESEWASSWRVELSNHVGVGNNVLALRREYVWTPAGADAAQEHRETTVVESMAWGIRPGDMDMLARPTIHPARGGRSGG